MVKLERIRQVAAIVPELEPAVERLHALFDIEPAVRQELTEFGLINAVIPVGDQFLELLQPVREDVSGARYLRRRGPGFYMLIFETDEGLRPRAEAEGLGIPVVWTADTDDFISVHFHPKAMADVLVSVDTAKRTGEWPAAGFAWRDQIRTKVVTGIHVFRVAGTDLSAMQKPFADLFGLDGAEPAPRGDTAVVRARVGHSGTYLDFVTPTSDAAHLAAYLQQHGPGPSGIELEARDLDDVVARADRLGVGHRPRRGGRSQGWEAVNLNADDVMGLPITLVQRFGDENPWARGA